MTEEKDPKYRNLLLGLLFDGIGMLSFAIPGIGEFSDVIWAPIAGWLMTRLYKGRVGQAAGLITFAEELIPGMDIVPTFTLTWIYTYLLSKKKERQIVKTICRSPNFNSVFTIQYSD